jgi:hypothetical protein
MLDSSVVDPLDNLMLAAETARPFFGQLLASIVKRIGGLEVTSSLKLCPLKARRRVLETANNDYA